MGGPSLLLLFRQAGTHYHKEQAYGQSEQVGSKNFGRQRWRVWLVRCASAWALAYRGAGGLAGNCCLLPGGLFFLIVGAIFENALVVVLFGFLVVSLYAQVYRYRRVSTPAQRQQTKWAVFGALISVLGFVGIITVVNLLNLSQSPGTFGFLWGNTAVYVMLVCLPLSLGVAILRSRLWDIDVIINKTLVYGLLTGLLGALYAGLIIGLEHLASLITVQRSDQLVALVIRRWQSRRSFCRCAAASRS